jgi:hypothetical protein
MKPGEAAARLLLAPCVALLCFAACSSGPAASDEHACANGSCVGGGSGSSSSGSDNRGEAGNGVETGGGHGEAGTGVETSVGGGIEAGGGVDAGSGGGSGGDADLSYDAVDSANVVWGQPCLYDFGSSCPFSNPQECGNHQAIDVTFPNGPQLLNATLFAGLDCSTSALQDNFNDQQNTRSSELWMFTDDADVAGVSPSNPTSVIWWVGPLTADGYPPAGAPTTGCINYTSAMAVCQ